MKRTIFTGLLAGTVLMFGAATAQADILTFNLDYAFSGTVPNSSSPFLIATFKDGTDCPTCAAGTVELILTSNLDAAGEFASEWDLNSKVALTGITASTTSGSFNAPTIEAFSEDHYKADGDGLYDFGFLFDTSGGSSTTRFDGSDSATFILSAASAINVLTFQQLSTDAGGSGPFYTAAHIQGIGASSCSGWVSDGNGLSGAASGTTTCASVPDSGTTVGLLGLAMLGLGILRRRLA